MTIATFEHDHRTNLTERGTARLAAGGIVAAWIIAAGRVLSQAASRRVETARRRRWRRKAIRELRALSNRALVDIGLDRSMIVSAVLEREAALFGTAAE